jgi:hypothetical protein
MKTTRLDELLNIRLDRRLTAAEAVELETLLAADETARQRAAGYGRLETLLEEISEPDAPAGLIQRVMAEIEAQSQRPARVAFGWTPRVIWGGGWVMAKKAMIGVAAAAAAGLVVFAITGYPHIGGNGTEGSVGAAKRAQAPQIAASDVNTGDPAVQAFLQSETFDHLLKDPDAKKLLEDSSFRADLRDANMRSAIASDEMHAMFAKADLAAAFAQSDMRAFLAQAGIRAALARDDFRAALRQANFEAALKNANLQDAMARSALEAALRNGQTRAAFASTELQAAFARADIRAALASDAFRQRIADANMQAAMRSSALSAAIKNAAFESALKSAAFESALRSRQ